MKKKEYFYALNGWRFILSLLIVLYHTPAEWRSSIADWNFGNIIVLFFFVLSGFLLTLGYKDKIQNGTVGYKDFVIKRALTVFPIQILMTLLFVIFGINVVTYWAVPFHLTLTQSLIPLWEVNFTLNTGSWFLSSIFICYLLLPPVLMFARNRTKFLLIYLISVFVWNILVFIKPDTIGTKWLCYINPFARFIDFSAGILLALYWTEIKSLFKNMLQNKIVSTICEIGLLAVLVYCFANTGLQTYNNYTILRYPVIFLFILIFALGYGPISKLLGSKLFNKLGDLSIAIYMCHGFILYFTQKIGLNDISIITTYILTILFSYILVHYYCPTAQILFVGFLRKNK
jgi:peptidoglycan/LPS O-acetylase OafA/YrhL